MKSPSSEIITDRRFTFPDKVKVSLNEKKTVEEKNDSFENGNNRYVNSQGMKFVYIPAGSFMMGSPDSDTAAHEIEKPYRSVTISKGFYMQVTEVTQSQWKKIMGINPSKHQDCGGDCPVDTVSWYDVQEYIRLLNDQSDRGKYRLPTEAEWEYVCKTGKEIRYTFGNYGKLLDQYAWYEKNSRGETHSVGLKKPNEWGIYDIHGNVSEWTQDIYSTAKRGGNTRVLKGGSYRYSEGICRCARRAMDNENSRGSYPSTGFRLIWEE